MSKTRHTKVRRAKARVKPVELSASDRRELRNFRRFLALKDRYLPKMLTRPRWQRYLGLTPEEAQTLHPCTPTPNNNVV